MEYNLKEVAGRIKDLREDHDLTQAQIAEKLGLYTTTYQRYERGEREVPFDIIIQIAKEYNISIDYIAELIQKPQAPGGGVYKMPPKCKKQTNAIKEKYRGTQK